MMIAIICVLLLLTYPSMFVLGTLVGFTYWKCKEVDVKTIVDIEKDSGFPKKEENQNTKLINDYFDNFLKFGGEGQ